VLPGFKVELYASGLNDPRLIRTAPNASLGLTFYDGKQFPAEYQGDIFACEHGSWNRSVRVGYEVIRVPPASDRPRHRGLRRFHDGIRGG
jgi:glucose/arabinose dehydrogenase